MQNKGWKSLELILKNITFFCVFLYVCIFDQNTDLPRQMLSVWLVQFKFKFKKLTPKMGYEANYLHVVYPDLDQMFAKHIEI